MLEARVVLGISLDGAMVDISLRRGRRYRLRYGRPGEWRIVYEDGRRTVQGRTAPYEFRSVEQMRYDFERDVENLENPHRQPR